MFRGEECILEGQVGTLDFYDNVVAPYKGRVEACYVDKKTPSDVFYFNLSDSVGCFVSRNTTALEYFKDLPEPPSELEKA